MIKFKEGVSIKVLRLETIAMMYAIGIVFKNAKEPFTITCVNEGHGPEDPHTNGYAFDIRTHGIQESVVRDIVNRLDDVLGDDYFIQYEALGTENEHIHCQVRKGLWQEKIKGDTL